MLSAEGGVEFGGKLTVVYLGVLHSRGHCYSPGFFCHCIQTGLLQGGAHCRIGMNETSPLGAALAVIYPHRAVIINSL